MKFFSLCSKNGCFFGARGTPRPEKYARHALNLRGLSSAGRAPALQAGGREFESLSLHARRLQEPGKQPVKAAA